MPDAPPDVIPGRHVRVEPSSGIGSDRTSDTGHVPNHLLGGLNIPCSQHFPLRCPPIPNRVRKKREIVGQKVLVSLI